MKRLLNVPLRSPRLTLAVMLVLTAFFGVFAARIKVDSSIENLLPADDPDKLYYDDVKKIFGDEEIAVIGVFADDVFAPRTLAKIDQLSTRLTQMEGVHEVLSLTTVKGVEMSDFGLSAGRLMQKLPETAEEAAAFRAKVLANPLYLKNVVAADGRAAGVTVVFDDMSDDEFLHRGIEDKLRALIAELGGPEQYAITGIPTIKVNAARLMEGDTNKFTPLAMLLVVIVLAFAFRTPRGVLVPFSTVVIGVVWTTGTMVLAGSAINLGTLVLNPLLMVIGVASGIHLISEYYQELKPGHSQAETVAHAMERVSVPILVAAATTLIGFGTLIFTPIRAVREFGIYSVFGIVAILLAAFTVVPALLVLLPLPKRIPTAQENAEGFVPRTLQGIGTFAVRHRRAVLVCTAIGMLLSFWGISKIQVETDYIGFFRPDSSIRIENTLIAERLAGTQPVYVVIDGDGPQSVTRLDVLNAMRDLQEFIDAQPGVDKTISLVDYLRLVRHVLQPDEPTALPDSQAEIGQILLLVDPADIRAVVNGDQSRANIIVRTRLSRSGEVGAFVQRVQEFAASHFPHGISVHPTGTTVLLGQSADSLAWGQVTSLWQELSALLALLSFMFLSLRVGFLALIPNVVPTVVLFGIMGWAGISLNISTSMIAAIAVGIAIDDTIHLLDTFNEGMRKTGSQEQAIIAAMGSVGQAAFFIALALSAGFFIVCLSNFQPVMHFGLLSGVTMLIALVIELFLTPALVTTTKIITLWDLMFLKLGPEPHKQISLFVGLRPFQAKLVVLMGHLEAVKHGAYITRRGEIKPELYVLLNGRAEVQREGGLVIRTMGRGDVIGEMGLLRKQPRSADVIAGEDMDYLVLDERFLQRIQRRYPRIAAKVFLNLTRILSDRLESTTDALAAMPRVAAGS
ncbi:MAG: MMPL family transporter [Deltaproteobacteria bacterium]|nr:MMPL family transporter [Deltaproteobacteria bacterium]MBI3388460.1 MMPL family transporter [Deltaproteobacteria bacterium]